MHYRRVFALPIPCRECQVIKRLIGIIELGVPIALGLSEHRHANVNDKSVNW
jgi:hypothetical protein